MARIRTIKPEFWTNEQVANCSIASRLLFIGLWNFVDDNGILPVSLNKIKAFIFPYESYTPTDISSLLNELCDQNLITFYKVDEQLYLLVTQWKKLQRINRPTDKYAPPPNNFEPVRLTTNNNSMSTHGGLTEDSLNFAKVPANRGVEATHSQVKREPFNPTIQVIFEHWKTVMEDPYAILDEHRASFIQKALDMGYSEAALCQAIVGCSLTPYNMGLEHTTTLLNDVSIIFKNASQIGRFLRHFVNPPKSKEQREEENETVKWVKKNIDPNDPEYEEALRIARAPINWRDEDHSHHSYEPRPQITSEYFNDSMDAITYDD